ncbi:ABC transporter ATP-binding protein [Alkaliphilus hydrothermalis]|uniref:ABC-2 type transport system ATP-binding protein n=1 Tax=Alkaliphilus hydrothermalis TaxID=1482730 RepID=A0ABS2NRF0_9FIRM|nr:ABC transporter ATP-binding protein [Alkaliphilus hydrothermalis]MBM7615511.1 ABC-2 type transport system ATP-binding protein [Alkaliphilus hydrothermalis]
MGKVVKIIGARKTFGEKPVLTGLNLSIPKQSIYAILGHNGAGKTTTCRIIQGLCNLDEGSVTVFGEEPTKNFKAISRKLGVLSEDLGLYENLTIKEYLHMYGSIYGMDKKSINMQIDRLLEYFELSDSLNTTISKFSRGMKKKVALIRTVIHDPSLIILDEPLNGLDPVIAEKFCEFIYKLKKEEKKTIILTSHHLDEIEKIIDDYSILKHGKTVDIVDDTTDELIYQIKISGDSIEAFNLHFEALSRAYRILHNRDDILISLSSEKELNNFIGNLIEKDIYLTALNRCKSSLKEVYMRYGS